MRTGKKWNSIKNIFVILLLVALTFAALDLQRRYYDRADEKLFSQVMLSEYSVTVVNDKVGMEQKIDALRDDLSIVAEGNEEYSAEELETYRNNLIAEIDSVLEYGWRDWIVGALSADDLMEHLHAIDILRVDDDKLYSFSLGIYEFWNPHYWASEPSMILFDMESGKILYMQAYAEDLLADMVVWSDSDYSYGVSVYETDAGANVALTEVSYYDALSDYYNMEFSSGTSAVMTDNYLTMCPFTFADLQGETFADIYDIIYRDYSKWFYD